jgi:hypothetical protein
MKAKASNNDMTAVVRHAFGDFGIRIPDCGLADPKSTIRHPQWR